MKTKKTHKTATCTTELTIRADCGNIPLSISVTSYAGMEKLTSRLADIAGVAAKLLTHSPQDGIRVSLKDRKLDAELSKMIAAAEQDAANVIDYLLAHSKKPGRKTRRTK